MSVARKVGKLGQMRVGTKVLLTVVLLAGKKEMLMAGMMVHLKVEY